MAPKIKDADIKTILAEVESDIARFTKSEASASASPVAKDDKPPMPEASASASPEASASASPGSAVEGSASPSGDPSAPPADPSAPPADPSAAPADPAVAAPADQPVSMEALQAEYEQLAQANPEEFRMHLEAIHAAAARALGAGAGMPADPSAPPSPSAPPMAPPPSASPASPPQMAMGELKVGDGSGKELPVKKSEADVKLEKAEAELAALRADVTSSKADVANLVKAIEKIAKLPLRKAVTDVAFVAKSPEVKDAKPPSSKDIDAHFRKITAEPGLKKAERDLITGWYEGRVTLEQLSGLLPKSEKPQ